MAETTTIEYEALGDLINAETRTLFEAVDKLSSLGVGRIANLPQVIVVGDRSSGKSSVLEAISHIKFPVQSGLCTRFATELVLRPAISPSIHAWVQFADVNKAPQRLQAADLSQEAINNIFSAAKAYMGLSDDAGGYSKDVLCLEVEGPDIHPLKLVDLPGFYLAGTGAQSTEGTATVKEIVKSYMKKKNTIILAVVSAETDIGVQVVMEEAAKHDISKDRTLGIITKPDRIFPGSPDEHKFVRIIRGHDTSHNLKLGWHVLRNREGYEKDFGDRDLVEAHFFEANPWASIPTTHRGVTSLRKRLGKILQDHIRKSLPAVLDDIQEKLNERKANLAQLGQPRSTLSDKRAYLIHVADKFQRLVHDGIRGFYKDPFFSGFDESDRKLRSQLRNFARAIRCVLLKYGPGQNIIASDSVQDDRTEPQHLEEFLDLLTFDLPVPEEITRSDLAAELDKQAFASQGMEFPGYINMDLVVQLFQRQAQPWHFIGQVYIREVLSTTRVFVEHVLAHATGPSGTNNVMDAILDNYVNAFFESKEELLESKLEEIFRPFQEGYALPLDDEFEEAMKARVAERSIASAVQPLAKQPQTQSVDLNQKSESSASQRIIDTMQIFYDMSLRTFTDNLINLVIESCLVQALPSIFTSRDVVDMSDGKVDELAAEPKEAADYRSQLKEDIKLLEQGRAQCRRYQPRHTATISRTPLRRSKFHIDDEPAVSRMPNGHQPRATVTNSTKPQESKDLPTSVSSDLSSPGAAAAVSEVAESRSKSPAVDKAAIPATNSGLESVANPTPPANAPLIPNSKSPSGLFIPASNPAPQAASGSLLDNKATFRLSNTGSELSGNNTPARAGSPLLGSKTAVESEAKPKKSGYIGLFSSVRKASPTTGASGSTNIFANVEKASPATTGASIFGPSQASNPSPSGNQANFTLLGGSGSSSQPLGSASPSVSSAKTSGGLFSSPGKQT